MTGFSPRPEGGACSQSRRWLLALLVGVAVLTGNSLPHKDHLMAADLEGRVRAPEFDAGLAWLNSAGPIRLKDLKGKIVVLDFWTLC